MEFAVCPACKQSVLDDDAVNCPFCGSSMKAKPGSAKPAAVAAPSKSTAKPPGGKPSPTPGPGDDSPFDIGEDLSSRAIPASATRTKSRPLRVQCPMCETVGYVPADASGQSVKCANPKCLVPVFTAPAAEPKQPPPPPPAKPQRSLALVGGVTVALMAVGGGIAWFVASQPQSTTLKGPSQEDLDLVKSLSNQKSPPPAVAASKQKPDDPVPDNTPDVPARTGAAWQTALLKTMNDAALQPRQNRSKPYCRRLSAEAFALTGNLKGAQEQLSALEKVGKDVPFYQVSPWVEIGWQQLIQGDRKAADQSVEHAWTSAEKLPKTGRDRLESAIALAALLIATQRPADAETLFTAHQATDDSAQLAAMHRAVRAYGTFDLAEADAQRPALPWRSPLRTGTVHELVARQQADLARAWADQLPGERDRAEALAAWAEGAAGLAHLTATDSDAELWKKPLETLTPPGKILAFARLGLSLSHAGKIAPAVECLAHAAEQLAAVPLFSEEPFPDSVAEMSKFRPPESAPREFLAAAAAEAAHLAAQLGKTEQAEALLQIALAQIRSLAPNFASIQRRLKQTESAGINSLRDELKQQLKLKTREDAIAAASAYRKNLDDWAAAGQQRVALETQLLTRAVAWGLLDSVWSSIRQGTTKEDAAEADNLIFTHLPSLLAEHYRKAGRTDRVELVAAAWNQLMPEKPLPPPPAKVLAEALNSQETSRYEQAAQFVKDWKSPAAEQDLLALRAVCQAAGQERYAPALALTSLLADPVLKEECYLLIAGMAGRKGNFAIVEAHLAEIGQASEKVALARGLLAGQARHAASPGDKGQP